MYTSVEANVCCRLMRVCFTAGGASGAGKADLILVSRLYAEIFAAQRHKNIPGSSEPLLCSSVVSPCSRLETPACFPASILMCLFQHAEKWL